MTAILSAAHSAHNALTEFCMLGSMPGTKGVNINGRWEKVHPCQLESSRSWLITCFGCLGRPRGELSR